MLYRRSFIYILMLLMVLMNGCGLFDNTIEKVDLVPEYDHLDFPYMIHTLATHLDIPWSLDYAPDGRLFFTERTGSVRVIVNGDLIEEPVITFNDPFLHKGEGGLLGLAIDPNFTENHYLYVYHTYSEGEEVRNQILRLVEKDNRAVVDRVIFEDLPGDRFHNGGRIKIGPDHLLYTSVGDALNPDL